MTEALKFFSRHSAAIHFIFFLLLVVSMAYTFGFVSGFAQAALLARGV